MQLIPNTLTIAGSDSSGGAGIQADLKTFVAHKCYGLSIICALTAQNTQGVQGVLPTPPEFIAQQFDSVFSDIPIHAAKIGMLGNAATINIVADFILSFEKLPLQNSVTPKTFGASQSLVPTHKLRWKKPFPILVLDPVMISQSGHKLLEDDAINALKTKLIPLATLITPNLPEAAALLGCDEATNIQEMERQATALLNLGAQAVFIKGGHMATGDAVDVLAYKDKIHHFSALRIHTQNTHGTGCTISAAITANLAHGLDLVNAIHNAKIYLTGALEAAQFHQLGKGDGPVYHFYQFWKENT